MCRWPGLIGVTVLQGEGLPAYPVGSHDGTDNRGSGGGWWVVVTIGVSVNFGALTCQCHRTNLASAATGERKSRDVGVASQERWHGAPNRGRPVPKPPRDPLDFHGITEGQLEAGHSQPDKQDAPIVIGKVGRGLSPLVSSRFVRGTLDPGQSRVFIRRTRQWGRLGCELLCWPWPGGSASSMLCSPRNRILNRRI